MAARSLFGTIVDEWWGRHKAHVDRAAVERAMQENGELTPAFVFLVFVSCAIATLGLLLDSAAVVIGAMLIAPLMGPINLLGYAIAKTDPVSGRRAALALSFGVAAALVTSYSIVTISPFIPPTAQILARTNPNFFDLLVAVFSGLVAGFSIIRAQGGTFAGVAIATALMPPLATSGYGWANASWEIFSGAFLLFLTNMLAIAFSVAGVSLWYGFGKWPRAADFAWRGAAGALVLALLSIPLVRTLDSSVNQAILSRQVQDIVSNTLPAGTRIQQLTVQQTPGETAPRIQLVVLTRHYDEALPKRLEAVLDARFGRATDLSLDQLVANTDTARSDRQLTQQVATLLRSQAQGSSVRASVDALLPARVSGLIQDEAARTLTVYLLPDAAPALPALQEAERQLAAKFSGYTVRVVPPVSALPPLLFGAEADTLSADASRQLDASIWALKRWGVARVVVTAHASLNEAGRGTRALAEARAGNVGKLLAAQDIVAQKNTAYPVTGQAALERETGAVALRSVYMTLGPTAP